MNARVAFAICLAAAAVSWIAPTGAFGAAAPGNRAVSASIVAEGSGYSAPIVSTCIVNGLTGGTCSITIFNNATAQQTYTVTKQSDTGNAVGAWDVDGHANVGRVATGNAGAIGSTSVVTIPIVNCFPACGQKNVYWMIQGTKANVLDSREEKLPLVVTYT